MERKKYFPYVSTDRPSKKFYIITNDNKKVYFGQTGYDHFTEGHLDERRLYPSYDQAMKRINKIVKKML
jgi:hypothetical protein